MDKFIEEFNLFCGGKYPYLRIKKVVLYEYEHKAEIYFALPEDIYENGFDNNITKELNRFCQKIARGYSCDFFFERMVITEEIVCAKIFDFFTLKYPFIFASLNKSCICADIAETIDVTLTLEEDVYELVSRTDFAKELILELEDDFVLSAQLTFKLVPKGEIEVSGPQENNEFYKRNVPILSSEYLCGQNSQFVPMPTFIDTVSRAQDNASVCGTIKEIIPRTYEKDPDSPYKYFKFSYKILLDDFTGNITAYFKTNDEECPLSKLAPGDQILCKGRIAYSQRSSEFVVYVKTILRCVLDNKKIMDAIRPLPPPEVLKIPALKYKGNDFIVEQTLEDYSENITRGVVFDAVFFTYRCTNKDVFSPWEICMLSFSEGKCEDVYKCYVRVSNMEAIDPEYKAVVSSSKRLSELIGDILCFCKGRLFVCKGAQDIVNEINTLAKPQRFVFKTELLDADKLGYKTALKYEPSFERNLKEQGISLGGEDSYSAAIAMAKLYIKVKK